MEALAHLGENTKVLRRLERRFRADLNPQGVIAEGLFDRLWSSYLRCLLAARTEMMVFLRQDMGRGNTETGTMLRQAGLPTLVIDDSCEGSSDGRPLKPDLLGELALVQKYDRHFAKEMYRALGLLLMLRRSGEAGLEQSFANLFGIEG